MRVTLVIQKLGGLRGGAERVVIELAEALAGRGHEVTIATYEPGVDAPGFAASGVTYVNVFPRPLRAVLRLVFSGGRMDSTETAVSSGGNVGIVARAKWSATHGLFARRLARWLRRHPQDAVVGFLPPAISAVALAGERLGHRRPRIIASTHNVPDVDFGPAGRWDQNPVARRTNLRALELADVVTVLQPEFIEQLPAGARSRAIVVPNAVARLAAPTGQARTPTILGAGRLTDVKRFDVLIEAFGRVADDIPGWNVVIHGDGPEQARLHELVVRLGLEGRVVLPGATAQIADAYDRARILCHPARYEGFGLSVAEGILHGLYVLASSECTGVNRLVEHGASGLLVDEGADPVAAFASGLIRLVDDAPADELRNAAAERLAERYSPVQIVDRWERVLSESESTN